MNRLVGRVLLVGRRTIAAPDGPYAAAAALGLLAIIEVVQRGGLSPTDLSSSLLLGLLATTPLAVARTHDVAAAGAVTAATFLTLASGQRPTAAGLLAQVVVLGLVGFRRPVWVAALFATPFAVYAAVPAGPVGPLFRLLLLITAAGALGVGLVRRSGDDAVARAAVNRAEEEELLDHLARGERARIARELHDVVAHHISMIAVQAEAARLTTSGMPREGAARLRAIGDTARQALTEMRRLLGVLREDAGPTATRAPQPGLEQLNDLVDEARDATAGSARLIVSGSVAALEPGIELTAYRLVQEALTNARRHAPGAAVDVELHYAPEALRLRVRDNGPGCSAGGRPPGHGLLGMRERAAAVGGTLCAGTATPAGFVVEATLPTGDPVTAAAPVRVLVVDDQEVVRAGFAALLATQPDFAVVGAAVDGADAVRCCAELRPDVVLMDVRMPVLDGIEATRLIAARTAGSGRPRIVMLTTFDLDDHVYDALRAGASGFLLKDVTAEGLFDAVRVVAAGEALLDPGVTRRLIGEFLRLRPPAGRVSAPLDALTPRETEVLRLVAEGLSNREIADRLVVSDQTVKSHVSRMLAKLGLRDRAQAVVAAYESGLVVPRSDR